LPASAWLGQAAPSRSKKFQILVDYLAEVHGLQGPCALILRIKMTSHLSGLADPDIFQFRVMCATANFQRSNAFFRALAKKTASRGRRIRYVYKNGHTVRSTFSKKRYTLPS
jgi:hypothetical protein